MVKTFGILGILFVLQATFGMFMTERALIECVDCDQFRNYSPLGVANAIQAVTGIGLILIAISGRIFNSLKYLALSGILFIIGVLVNTISVFMFVFKSAQVIEIPIKIGLACIIVGWIVFLLAFATAKMADNKA